MNSLGKSLSEKAWHYYVTMTVFYIKGGNSNFLIWFFIQFECSFFFKWSYFGVFYSQFNKYSFITKRGPKFEILHIWKIYGICIFHPILIKFFFFELNGLRTFCSVSTNFLNLLWFWRWTQPKAQDKQQKPNPKILTFLHHILKQFFFLAKWSSLWLIDGALKIFPLSLMASVINNQDL